MPVTLAEQSALVITNSAWRAFWPIDVRKTLVQAAKTEGDMPQFAVARVRWALKSAKQIDAKMERDLLVGETLIATKSVLVPSR